MCAVHECVHVHVHIPVYLPVCERVLLLFSVLTSIDSDEESSETSSLTSALARYMEVYFTCTLYGYVGCACLYAIVHVCKVMCIYSVLLCSHQCVHVLYIVFLTHTVALIS